METNRVAINDLDGVSLYYAIGIGKGGVFTGQVLSLIHEYQVEYDTFTSVEYLLREYVGHIEYDTIFQEYIVTSRVDENIFAVSALLPEAIAMCAAKVIYKDKSHVESTGHIRRSPLKWMGLDIPVCLIDNW